MILGLAAAQRSDGASEGFSKGRFQSITVNRQHDMMEKDNMDDG
jgi:hypothetical protein